MARRVFFSFHYQDVIDFRANVVRNHWLTKNLFEKSQFVLEKDYLGGKALKIPLFCASKDQTIALLPTFQTGSKVTPLYI